MKRRIAESVSIFLVYIMFARVNRNSRNYKARASRAFRTDSQYTVMVHARARLPPCCIAELIERLPASGVPSATLVRFFIAIRADYRAVDTSPANSWHRDALALIARRRGRTLCGIVEPLVGGSLLVRPLLRRTVAHVCALIHRKNGVFAAPRYHVGR
jgi:hypothetical protein